MKYDLNTYVDSLLEQKNLSHLDPKILAEMKNDLLSRIENRINTIIASNIPEDVHDEFEKLVESKASDEKVQEFIAEKVPNLPALITVDLAQFQSVYLGTGK